MNATRSFESVLHEVGRCVPYTERPSGEPLATKPAALSRPAEAALAASMNPVDHAILTWLNHFARHAYLFDVAVSAVAHADLLKGGLLTAALLWFWFGDGPSRARHREIVVATAVACVAAIVVGRLMALALPFRLRPFQNPALSFVLPYGSGDGLREWSAFPSDHAMLFATMATGLWFVSRRLGVAVHLYALAFIYFPRVYLGLHHPTDIAAGALLGVAFGAAANGERLRGTLSRLPLRWAQAHAPSFYVLAFLAALQVATMFGEARHLASGAFSAARVAWCSVSTGGDTVRCRPHHPAARPAGEALAAAAPASAAGLDVRTVPVADACETLSRCRGPRGCDPAEVRVIVERLGRSGGAALERTPTAVPAAQ